MNVLMIGIDVSKDTLEVSLCPPQGHPVALRSYPNEPSHFEALAKSAEEQAQQHGCAGVQLILEPTGGYEQPLACFAYQRGWPVSLPNPRHVRDWARGMGVRSKTDRLDSQVLAHYGRERQPPLWQPLPEQVAILSDLLDRRHDLEQMRQQERNRTHALRAQGRYYGATQRSLEQNLARLETSLQELEQEIRQHLADHPQLQQQAQTLRQVPGVGAKNVLPLLVLCSRWSGLTQHQGTGKGLTAYVGLDPRLHQSGRTIHHHAAISRQGDPTLRQLLFMGALGGTRSRTSALRVFYDRLLSAGKPKMVALVAAARKILVWAWSVFRDGVSFDPQRAQARTKAHA